MLSLFVVTAFVMLIGVAREAINEGLGVAAVVRLIPFATPNALSLAVPGTALFSICCVYGRMAADNEFTVLQSVGISPITAVFPAVLFATLLSLASVGIINVAFTWGFHGAQRVVMTSIEGIAYHVLERDRSFTKGSLTLTVREVVGKELIEPVIKIRRAHQGDLTIRGRRAVLQYDDADEDLQLSITDGFATVGDQAAFHFSDTFTYTIPVKDRPDYDLLTANPSHMPMRDLPLASVRQRVDIRQRESEKTIRTGFSLLTSRYDELVDSASQKREGALTSSSKRLHRLDAEMHRRWASGFTCLALAMVGIPLATRLRTADTMTTFGIVFLPTLFTYYPIFALTLDLAKDGQIAAQGVWIANVLFVAIGLFLMRKTLFTPA